MVSQFKPTGSIQAAVDSAKEGAKIQLMAKTYYEHVEVPKSLEIVGKGFYENNSGWPTGRGSVFTIGSDTNRNLDVKLSKMTITNGLGSNARGCSWFYLRQLEAVFSTTEV